MKILLVLFLMILPLQAQEKQPIQYYQASSIELQILEEEITQLETAIQAERIAQDIKVENLELIILDKEKKIQILKQLIEVGGVLLISSIAMNILFIALK